MEFTHRLGSETNELTAECSFCECFDILFMWADPSQHPLATSLFCSNVALLRIASAPVVDFEKGVEVIGIIYAVGMVAAVEEVEVEPSGPKPSCIFETN